MGIVSVCVFIAFFAGLLVLRFKLSGLARDFDKDEPERAGLVWASRACLVVVLIAAAGIVDNYVWKIPNPFGGPTAGNEMPERSPPPPKPRKPDVQADDLRPDMKDVRDEHRERLKDFETR